MRFSDDFVREVVNRTDLVQLMEERGVALRRTGSTFKACCPFHSEKTPSFNVNPQRGFFHCFGCGTSGDAIRFLMLFERLTFAEAVTDLANKAGVELRHEGKSNSANLTRKLVCMLYNSLAASINNNCKDQLDKMFVHT